MKILDILNSPWAISHQRLIEIQRIYRTHFHGEKIDWKGMEAKAGIIERSDTEKPYIIDNGVAVIDVSGVLTKSLSFFSFLFGGSSMSEIADTFRGAMADRDVKSILLRIDSPGGTVDGTQELSNAIHAGKNSKPIIAFSDGMMASAAYWIASAADAIFISGDTVEVGSIGVVATHIDMSKQDEMFGEKVTEITAGKYKRIASSHAALSDDGKQYIQAQVDHIYSVFIADVARNRNISNEEALAMADGKIFMGENAVKAGLVDGVSTFDQIINQMSSGEMNLKNKQIQEETQVMDINQLKKDHPEVFQAAIEQGKKEMSESVSVQIATAKAEGIAAEQKRILEIQDVSVPGHEEIITAAIKDSKITASDVAMQIVIAEKKLRANALAASEADAKRLTEIKSAASETQTTGATVDDSLPVEERAKALWDKDQKVRAEFGSLEVYTAYLKNATAGRVKILGK